jgi:hypothetical protein
MQGKKTWLLACALAAAGAFSLNPGAAEARVAVQIYATAPPPPLRVEHVPPPRHGYVWAPGYWRWQGHRYVWVGGHWIRGRHGYHYAPPHWEREGRRWRYYDGRWHR